MAVWQFGRFWPVLPGLAGLFAFSGQYNEHPPIAVINVNGKLF